jgi:hypothetical protein
MASQPRASEHDLIWNGDLKNRNHPRLMWALNPKIICLSERIGGREGKREREREREREKEIQTGTGEDDHM